MLLRNLLLTTIFSYSLLLNAAPVHEHAKKMKWGQMFATIKADFTSLNDLEADTNQTVLDIALPIAPHEVVEVLLRIGAQPGILIELNAVEERTPLPSDLLEELLDAVIERYTPTQPDEESSEEWPLEMETPLGTELPYTPEEEKVRPSRNLAANENDGAQIKLVLSFDSLPN